MKLSTEVIVTWDSMPEPFQSVGVSVSVAGDTVQLLASDEVRIMVTLAVGALVRRMVEIVCALCSLIVIVVGLTTMLAVWRSNTVTITSSTSSAPSAA